MAPHASPRALRPCSPYFNSARAIPVAAHQRTRASVDWDPTAARGDSRLPRDKSNHPRSESSMRQDGSLRGVPAIRHIHIIGTMGHRTGVARMFSPYSTETSERGHQPTLDGRVLRIVRESPSPTNPQLPESFSSGERTCAQNCWRRPCETPFPAHKERHNPAEYACRFSSPIHSSRRRSSICHPDRGHRKNPLPRPSYHSGGPPFCSQTDLGSTTAPAE